MNRRNFLKKIFKVTVGAPVVPVVIQHTGVLKTIGEWVKRIFFKHRIGNFAAFTFPLIKQVMPSLVIKDFVQVQPMNLPSAQLFYMDFRYNEKLKYEKSN